MAVYTRGDKARRAMSMPIGARSALRVITRIAIPVRHGSARMETARFHLCRLSRARGWEETEET